jgi:diaminopimelate epimerase
VMDGGELLIGWNEMGHVTMRGPAETSFIGALEEWV